jgi:hypothetical protein
MGQRYCVKSQKNAKLLPQGQVTAVTKLSGTQSVLLQVPDSKAVVK